MRTRHILERGIWLVALVLAALMPTGVGAQEADPNGPVAALTAALTAACRGNETTFANYLTADSAAAFRALPPDERSAFVKRFSLTDTPGHPLLSEDAQKHTVLRCQAADITVDYRMGEARVRENLAYVPVNVMNARETQFGLVRENGGWHLLSIGLVMLDVPQLSAQWKEEEDAAHDQAVMDTLRDLAGAIQKYRKAFGKLPESLAELGPAPKDEVSPQQASLVDEHLAAGAAGGYRFRYSIVPAADPAAESFELGAIPGEYGKTGRTSFFYDSEGKIHAADKQGAVAGPSDPLVEPASAEGAAPRDKIENNP